MAKRRRTWARLRKSDEGGRGNRLARAGRIRWIRKHAKPTATDD